MIETFYVTIAEQVVVVTIASDGAITVDGEAVALEQVGLDRVDSYHIRLASREQNTQIEALILPEPDGYEIQFGGATYHAEVQDELSYRVAQDQQAAAANLGSVTIKSPMPGVIFKTPTTVGDLVEKGDTLLILESMKMENELKAPRDGLVEAVHVSVTDSVTKGQKLITITNPDS